MGLAATDEWAGHEDKLAYFKSNTWTFLVPDTGMRVFDRDQQQFRLFNGQWQAATVQAEPTGGDIVDTEARAAIGALTTALRELGILPIP